MIHINKNSISIESLIELRLDLSYSLLVFGHLPDRFIDFLICKHGLSLLNQV